MNQRQERLKIILIGDSCKDITHYGHVNRLSPEGPIPILDYHSTTEAGGMIKNVYNNFTNLGVKNITLYAKLCEEKIRYIDEISKRQLLRMDNKIPEDKNAVDLEGLLMADLSGFDAIVISDYDKGYVTYDFVKSLRQRFEGPIFIDTKKPDLAKFKGCIIKINRSEWNNKISDGLDACIITGGGGEITYKHEMSFQEEYFAPPNVDAHDPCGCGDTFLASLVYDYLHTQNMPSAINFAMKAAAITVKKIGVYAPTYDEIIENENG